MVTQKDLQVTSDFFKNVYCSLDITVMELKEKIHIFINTPYVLIYNPMDFTPMIKFLGTDVVINYTFTIYDKLDSFLPHISDKIVIIGSRKEEIIYGSPNPDGAVELRIFDREFGTIEYNPNVC